MGAETLQVYGGVLSGTKPNAGVLVSCWGFVVGGRKVSDFLLATPKSTKPGICVMEEYKAS